MDELKITPDFTIDDIHKIREYNYEKRKTMTEDKKKKEMDSALEWFDNEIKKRTDKRIAV